MVSEAQNARWWAMAQQKTTRKIEIEKLITHRSWRKCIAHLRDYTGSQGTKGSRRREWQDLGPTSLLGPQMKCFGVPQLRLDWSVQIKKSRILVSYMGVFSNGYKGKALGYRGNSSSQGLLGKSYQKLTFAVTLQAIT